MNYLFYIVVALAILVPGVVVFYLWRMHRAEVKLRSTSLKYLDEVSYYDDVVKDRRR